MTGFIAATNTDRELWREQSELPADPDNYYAPAIYLTAGGGIGISVGGMVFVKKLREWHALANELERLHTLAQALGYPSVEDALKDIPRLVAPHLRPRPDYAALANPSPPITDGEETNNDRQ